MSSKSPSRRRKRGGQPGNHNAFQHGFYARRLPIDRDAIAAANLPPADNLDAEIAMLRIAIRNLVAKSADPQPLGIDLLLLRSFSLAFAALNRMIKTRYFIRDDSSAIHNFMHTVFQQIREETPGTILDDLTRDE